MKMKADNNVEMADDKEASTDEQIEASFGDVILTQQRLGARR